MPTVPGGQITSIARNTPSLFGMPGGSTERTPVYEAAFVYDSVLLIAPLTCGCVPVQSTIMWPPRFLKVTNSRIGRP